MIQRCLISLHIQRYVDIQFKTNHFSYTILSHKQKLLSFVPHIFANHSNGNFWKNKNNFHVWKA